MDVKHSVFFLYSYHKKSIFNYAIYIWKQIIGNHSGNHPGKQIIGKEIIGNYPGKEIIGNYPGKEIIGKHSEKQRIGKHSEKERIGNIRVEVIVKIVLWLLF